MNLLALLLFVSTNTGTDFVADASAEITYTVNISRDDLRLFVDDIGLFQRHMPGVVGVKRLPDNTYLYKTAKDVPLSGTMSVDFVIQKLVANDTLTIYRTPDVNDPNWMSCRVQLNPINERQTAINIKLRLRLSRDSGSEVHWLAPIFGADFISDRMQEDMQGMLKHFAESSNKELYQRFSNITERQ